MISQARASLASRSAIGQTSNTPSRTANRRSKTVEALSIAFLALLALIAFRVFASDYAAGSDSFGYVNEAERISRGHFYEAENVFSRFGLAEDSSLSFTLGARPFGSQGTVPTYPFGYPLLMALTLRFFGAGAMYWVTPVLGALALVATYLAARPLAGRIGAAAALAVTAILPNYLWCAIQPLSDVPAAFAASLALAAALNRRTLAWDALLGCSLGLGIWIRPNLVILVLPFVLYLALSRRWSSIGVMLLALLPFVVVEGIINYRLYGVPWSTGYGSVGLMFRLDDALPRALRHLNRLVDQQSIAGVVLFLIGLWSIRRWPRQAILLSAIALSFLAFFAAYPIDDAWWYGRFLVPAFPAVAIVEAAGVTALFGAGRLSRARRVAGLALVALVIGNGVQFAITHNVLRTAEGESRYARAGELVVGKVEQPALVLAMQNSGSARYYASAATARYDADPARLLPKLRQVAQAGGNVYLLVQPWEIELTTSQPGSERIFAGARLLGRAEPGDTRLYRLHILTPSEGNCSADSDLVFGGELALLGFEAKPSASGTSRSFDVALQWQALATPRRDYTVFVHALDEHDRIVAQFDVPMSVDGRPTSSWSPRSLTEVSGTISLPAEASDTVRLAAGLYNYPSMDRLAVTSGNGAGSDYPTICRLPAVRP